MANVFFTEITGNLNHSLVYKLKTEGHQVTVLVNTQEDAKFVESTGATVFWGDINNTESFVRALAAADIVIRTPEIFDIKFAQNEGIIVDSIIKTLEGTNKTFLYTSNAWVFGDTCSLLADEKTPLTPPAIVAPLALIETKVIEAAKKGIRTVVIRPAIVFGFDGGYVEELVTTARRERTVHYIADGKTYGTYIHIEDLVALYLAAIDKAPAGAVYHGASSDYVTTKELAEAIAKTFGIKEVVSLTAPQAETKYGVFAEVYGLNQKIDYPQTKTQLHWTPKQSAVREYLVAREKALSALTR